MVPGHGLWNLWFFKNNLFSFNYAWILIIKFRDFIFVARTEFYWESGDSILFPISFIILLACLSNFRCTYGTHHSCTCLSFRSNVKVLKHIQSFSACVFVLHSLCIVVSYSFKGPKFYYHEVWWFMYYA